MKPYARFFEAIAGRYERAYALDARTSRARMDRVLRELTAGARVLDLGVGTGRELSRLQDAGHDVVGLDVSPAMIALALRRARPIPLTLGDFWEPLPFADGEFGAALALHGTLAHAPSETAAAGLALELARVLAPGGVFVAELPAHGWLARLEPAGDDADEDRRARRIAPDRCVYEDRVVGVSIEAWIPEDRRWQMIFGDARFATTLEPLGTAENLLVARRA